MNIFISSVIRGLEDEREAAAEAISSLGHTPKRAEDFAASPDSSQVVCRAGVRQADVVVLLLGERYGDVQSSGKSATHEEYEEAQVTHRPVLAFVKNGISPEPAQAAFINEVRDWVGGEFHGRFGASADIDAEIVRAVHEFEVARAAGTADPAEIHTRAAAAVPNERGLGAATPRLALVVAGGPRQRVIRPQELEDADLARWVQREAMFGSFAVLSAESATQVERSGGRLRLAQLTGEVAISEDGTLTVVQPAYSEEGAMGLRAIIQEDVEERLAAALGFASDVLQHVDPLRRLSDVVPVAALLGGAHGAWRSRAEQQANPTTMSLNIHGSDRVIVPTEPLRLNRPALASTRLDVAADLSVMLRRAATERGWS